MSQEQEQKENEALAALLLGENPTHEAPAFAAVAQPKFLWSEKAETPGTIQGHTVLPTPSEVWKNDLEGNPSKAEITFAPGISPWARAIKLHEMLHARFTPDILDVANSKELEHVSDAAKQIAEDVRLATLARKRGLMEDQETYFPEKSWNRPLKKGVGRAEIETAAMFMGNYGQPLEGGWDSRNLGKFFERTRSDVSRNTKKALRNWATIVNKATKEPDPKEQFKRIANATQDALAQITTRKFQLPGPAKPTNAKPKAGGGKGSGAPQPGDGNSKGNSKEQEARARLEALAATAKAAREAKESEATKATNAAISAAVAKAARKLKLPTDAIAKAMAALAAKEREQVKQEEKNDQDMPPPDKGWYGGGHGFVGKDSRWSPYGDKPATPDRITAQNYSLDPSASACWGKMVTQIAPLQRNFRALVKRSGVASPEGPIPKYFARWYGDKQIFERQGLRRGGTLLIDVSGSMDWAWEMTRELIESTPAMTIAIYSGHDTHGHLTIIAKDGKLTGKDFKPDSMGHGGGNTVDGPALSWLAKQPRPRVWFSDGIVFPSGIRDYYRHFVCNHHSGKYHAVASGFVADAYRDVDRICRLGAIRRTLDPQMVKDIFQGRRAQASTPEETNLIVKFA